MMGKHPARTAAQRRALDAIGCGNYSPIMAKSTRDTMLKAGLIEQLSDVKMAAGPFTMRVERFQMPTPIHIAWCESVEDEEAPSHER